MGFLRLVFSFNYFKNLLMGVNVILGFIIENNVLCVFILILLDNLDLYRVGIFIII